MPIHSPGTLIRSMLSAWLSGAKAGSGQGGKGKDGEKKGGRAKGSLAKGSLAKGGRPKGPGMEGFPDTLRSKAQQWAELWGLPGLTESVTVEFSGRLRSSLGNCRPIQGRIRLAAHLENGNGELLEEVLCHELAHVAVYRLHGRRVRPHGPEWRKLVSAAGFEARARFKREDGNFPQKPSNPGVRG
ncbi:MAG: SprT family zinc-dependent metalloprotease [Gemmatimonadota bacterium]